VIAGRGPQRKKYHWDEIEKGNACTERNDEIKAEYGHHKEINR
jgi:hypothetical protein